MRCEEPLQKAADRSFLGRLFSASLSEFVSLEQGAASDSVFSGPLQTLCGDINGNHAWELGTTPDSSIGIRLGAWQIIYKATAHRLYFLFRYEEGRNPYQRSVGRSVRFLTKKFTWNGLLALARV